MKFRLFAMSVIAALTLYFSTAPSARPNANANKPSAPKTKPSSSAFHDTWRKLWEDHITWTRVVIMGVLDSLPGTDTYAARLLKNYEDMEDALKPYYGDDAEELGDLIQEHLLIAVEILNAAKAGDTAAQNDAVNRWYANGLEIATLMAEINPKYWPLSEGSTMWREHLDATLAEAVDHLSGNFTAEVSDYDTVHNLALEMADFFSDGIMSQFRSEFTHGNKQ